MRPALVFKESPAGTGLENFPCSDTIAPGGLR